MIAKVLDERAETIRKEIDEARRLREDAQKLLADYQQKHRSAGQEAEAIVEEARREAEAFAQETRAGLKDTLERRTKLAEDKIARAEAQAVDEVRAAAVEMAIAAAEKILREKAAGASRHRPDRPGHPRPQGPPELAGLRFLAVPPQSRFVMVGLGPTIHSSTRSGAYGWPDPRDKPEDDG